MIAVPGRKSILRSKTTRWLGRGLIWSLWGILPLVWNTPVLGTKTWVVGGTDHLWEASGSLDAVDATTEPGWIQPIRTTLSQNLALSDEQRTPEAYSFQPSIQSLGGLEYMIDGDPTTAFQMTLEATIGSSVLLDLGAVLPVSLIKFYPRQDDLHKERFLRAYQVYVTDRSLSAEGLILWDMVAPNWENDQSIVRVSVPNRYVRDVRIQAVTNLQWEIAEWEVYGQGFAPSATYTSHAIDLGGPANFGILTWATERDPAASMTIVTRSGKDPFPYTYYKFERPEEGVVDTVEVTEETYNDLKESDRFRVFDTENWSFWSAPYPSSGEVPIVSPGPRRYFQFQIQFQSGFFTDRVKVDSVAIEFSSPPVAQEVIGEMSPNIVSAGERTTFTYAVLPILHAGDTGFDALRVSTPLKAEIKELRIDGTSSTFEADTKDQAFTVTFPRIRRNRALLELTFDCQVLVYGTVFSGEVFDSQTAELPQEVVEGDASPTLDTNALSVGVSELGQEILSAVEVHPNPFSPNHDGSNDRASIRYHLLKLLSPARVVASVYDLSGAQIWSRTMHQESGVYAVEWDGKGSDGVMASPGVYLYSVSVHTASGKETKVGTFVVIY